MKLYKIVVYLLLISAALLMVIPFAWILLTALKGSEDLFVFPPHILPERLNFSNFVSVWKVIPFGAYILNSLIVSAASVFLNVFLFSLAAYPLARMQFRGKNLIFLMILCTMMVPSQVIMIPIYQIEMKLGLLNSLTGVVLPFSVNAFGIFLMRQFYKGIPKDIEDAAIIDGCSPVRIWWNILLPLSKPAIATLSVFTFVSSWSNFLWPLIVLRDSNKFTLPVGLSYLTGIFSANYKFVAAGAVISIVPVLVVFLLMQKYFIEGILSGSVKG